MYVTGTFYMAFLIPPRQQDKYFLVFLEKKRRQREQFHLSNIRETEKISCWSGLKLIGEPNVRNTERLEGNLIWATSFRYRRSYKIENL
jgi:hypothetical protein